MHDSIVIYRCIYIYIHFASPFKPIGFHRSIYIYWKSMVWNGLAMIVFISYQKTMLKMRLHPNELRMASFYNSRCASGHMQFRSEPINVFLARLLFFHQLHLSPWVQNLLYIQLQHRYRMFRSFCPKTVWPGSSISAPLAVKLSLDELCERSYSTSL